MLKRIAAALAAAVVLALGGTGVALASNGADDPPGHHQEHGNGDHGKHHHHGRHHHQGDHQGKGNKPGDDHGGKGNEPGDDNGGKTEATQTEEVPPMSGEYGY
jgi:Spy/CpxP family protein refolding chaperone